MKSVFLLGAGAAGGSLGVALKNAGYTIRGVFDPESNRRDEVAALTGAESCGEPLPEQLTGACIVLIAVPDGEIGRVAQDAIENHLCYPGATWFHTAGAVPAKALDSLRDHVSAIGSFHPAHPFPPGQVTPIERDTGFAVGGDLEAIEIAKQMAADLGGFVVQIEDEIRPLYHAATVMASNYIAALLFEASEAVADVEGIDRLLASLAKSAAVRAVDVGIPKSLSGPIVRGDTETIKSHLEALKDHPAAAQVYRLLGQTALNMAVLDKETARTISGLLKRS